MQSTALDPRIAIKVLVVEDEYLIASDISNALSAQGDEVVGPFATVGGAMAALDSGSEIDVGLLDINLRGEEVFALADALRERRIPFLFASGYDKSVVPDRFKNVMHRQKPVGERELLEDLTRLRRTA